MNISNLCLELLKADSELEVINTLKKGENYWDDDSQWKPFGGNENNWSAIGNQQGNAVSALVEKFVNSIDAVLMRECLLRGIDPTSNNAPQSIDKALEEYFKIPHGNLANVISAQRSKLAENIGLVATGAKRKSGNSPSLTIFDLGEGQTPQQMPETLLSLSKSNKLKIPFVQGKFNMGGTGVLPFCGKENLQLIISRRHPQITPSGDPSSNQWGFTLVRRQEPRHGRRSSMFTYLAPRGNILSFDQDSIALPDNKHGTQELPSLKWGTIIKLYEYQLDTLGTLITNNLLRAVSVALVKPGLPIRFFEKREYGGHSLENNMHGLNVRLDDDKRSLFEPDFPTSFDLSIEGEKMKATVYAFTKGGAKTYKGKEGVIFTINGQTHGFIHQRIFGRKSVNLGYIADDLLVIIDATTISARSREDLFMNSRDRLREGTLHDIIEKTIEEELKDHQGLRNLQERRRRESITEQLTDEKPLREVLEGILKKSPVLNSLFITGDQLSNPYKSTSAIQQDRVFTGKKHPTFFTILKKDSQRNVEFGRRFKIQFETDVENEYFIREDDQGQQTLSLDRQEVSTYSINLFNGLATLNVNLPVDANVGDSFTYQLDITDSTRLDPFSNSFRVTVIEATEHEHSKTGKRQLPSTEGKGNRQQPSMLALPHIEEVREEDWGKHDFDKYSALKFLRSGDSLDFFINMGNTYLLHEIKNKPKSSNPKLIESQYKYAFVLLGLGILSQSEQGEEPIDEEQFSKITRSLAPVILPIIGLGGLSVEDISGE
jgi:hypothetical protein